MEIPEIRIINRTGKPLTIVVLTTYRSKTPLRIGDEEVIDKKDLLDEVEFIEIIIKKWDYGQEE